jgi:hypothetical protein
MVDCYGGFSWWIAGCGECRWCWVVVALELRMDCWDCVAMVGLWIDFWVGIAMVLDIVMVDCWGRVAKHAFRLIVYHWEWDPNGRAAMVECNFPCMGGASKQSTYS